MNTSLLCASLTLALATVALPAAAAPTVATFTQNSEGFVGNAFRDTTVGNTAPAMHALVESFGLSLRTTSNAAFVGNYAATGSVDISIDVLTNSITYLGQEVSRYAVIELRDYDNPAEGYPYTSVWTTIGTLSASIGGWQHLTLNIADTSSTALPAGWGGYGAEDPVTFEPVLPAGRTFASVLASVDEFVFTTYVPGYFYGFTDFDVVMDNVSINHVGAVPEPATLLMLGVGLGGVLLRARRRKAGGSQA